MRRIVVLIAVFIWLEPALQQAPPRRGGVEFVVLKRFGEAVFALVVLGLAAMTVEGAVDRAVCALRTPSTL